MHDSTEINAGKTTLTPEVIFTIAKMSTLGVDGVASLSKIPPSIARIFKQPINDGIQLTIEDGLVYLDIYVDLKADQNVREVSRNIQLQVSRSISEMVGMEIGQINIHIENIKYEGE